MQCTTAQNKKKRLSRSSMWIWISLPDCSVITACPCEAHAGHFFCYVDGHKRSEDASCCPTWTLCQDGALTNAGLGERDTAPQKKKKAEEWEAHQMCALDLKALAHLQ